MRQREVSSLRVLDGYFLPNPDKNVIKCVVLSVRRWKGRLFNKKSIKHLADIYDCMEWFYTGVYCACHQGQEMLMDAAKFANEYSQLSSIVDGWESLTSLSPR